MTSSRRARNSPILDVCPSATQTDSTPSPPDGSSGLVTRTWSFRPERQRKVAKKKKPLRRATLEEICCSQPSPLSVLKWPSASRQPIPLHVLLFSAACEDSRPPVCAPPSFACFLFQRPSSEGPPLNLKPWRHRGLRKGRPLFSEGVANNHDAKSLFASLRFASLNPIPPSPLRRAHHGLPPRQQKCCSSRTELSSPPSPSSVG
jgi:hypothetical protein